jgi:hypothetical protein
MCLNNRDLGLSTGTFGQEAMDCLSSDHSKEGNGGIDFFIVLVVNLGVKSGTF